MFSPVSRYLFWIPVFDEKGWRFLTAALLPASGMSACRSLALQTFHIWSEYCCTHFVSKCNNRLPPHSLFLDINVFSWYVHIYSLSGKFFWLCHWFSATSVAHLEMLAVFPSVLMRRNISVAHLSCKFLTILFVLKTIVFSVYWSRKANEIILWRVICQSQLGVLYSSLAGSLKAVVRQSHTINELAQRILLYKPIYPL